MGIKFEYTVSSTLQQNDRVERKFATIFNWIHACNILCKCIYGQVHAGTQYNKRLWKF